MTTENDHKDIAVMLVSKATDSDKDVLLEWAQDMMEIRESDLSVTQKAKTSIAKTIESKALLPFVKILGSEIKRLGWDERGLPARIGLSVATASAMFLGSQGAGIAALGGAIGVPLWFVFGAGGAFAGVLIEEIQRTKAKGASPSELPSLEKEVEGEIVEIVKLDEK